jgi:hypothetical protein
MNDIIKALFGDSVARAVGSLSGSLSKGLAGLLEAWGILMLVRGLAGIAVDLLKTFEGRLVLGAAAVFAAGWYVQETYTVMPRAEVSALASKLAELEKRPVSCPQLEAVRKR